MKKIIITLSLLVISFHSISQTKNDYIFGYGSWFLEFPRFFNSYYNTSYFFCEYSRKLSDKNLYWSLRGEFYAKEDCYNAPIDGRMNIIVVPENIFPLESSIKHDLTSLGIKQLPTMDGKTTVLRLNSMIKYEFTYAKILFTAAYAGISMEYYHSQGLMDGDFFTFTDSMYPQGNTVIFFPNYLNGIDFCLTNAIQSGFIFNSKIKCGIDVKIDYFFNEGLMFFVNSLFLGYKF